jgi:hypothetical protein
MIVQHTDIQSVSRCLPSTPKLYTLRGVSAVYVKRNVSFRFCGPFRISGLCASERYSRPFGRGERDSVLLLLQQRAHTNRMTAPQYAFIKSTGLPQTPNHI